MKELQKKQLELDKFIYESNNITDVGDIFYNKIIALDVELGEFINEVESFKYWKKMPKWKKFLTYFKYKKSDWKALEEACDCLHFILSLANDMEVELKYMEAMKMSRDINLLYRYIKATLWKEIYIEDDEKSLNKILSLLIGIIKELGFTYEDLIKEYDRKYEINIQRQREGY